MKRYIYTLLFVFTFACTTTKVVHNTKKNDISGTWTLMEINNSNVENSEQSKLFEFSVEDCLIGSTWSFNSDGKSGGLKVSGENCDESSKKIHWLLYEPGDGSVNLQFKYVPFMDETATSGKGFQTIVVSVDENRMVMDASNKEETGTTSRLVFTKNTP